MIRPPVHRWITPPAMLTTVLAALLVASGGAAADDGVSAEALAPGSWSVQFSVQPNLTLGSFSGTTLSLKRHLASGNALRFGLSVNVGGGNEDLSDVFGDTSSTRTQASASDPNTWSIGVDSYYLWYAGRAAPVHAYWGAGPTVSWTRRHDERSQLQTLDRPG